LGYPKTIPVKRGEYCYIDDADDVICRLEVRQVEKTKVLETTTGCFYIVQGNPYTPSSGIISAARELIELTVRFCGGAVTELYFPIVPGAGTPPPSSLLSIRSAANCASVRRTGIQKYIDTSTRR